MRASLPSLTLLLTALQSCDATAPPAPRVVATPSRGSSIPDGQSPPGAPMEPYGTIPPALRTLPNDLLRGMRDIYVVGWTPATTLTAGSFHDRATLDFALHARAGECYRGIAAIFDHASQELPRVDLEAYDATGLLERDSSYAAGKLLGIRQPLCVTRDQVLRLRISAERASGYFALALYHTRDTAQGAPSAPQVQAVPTYTTPAIEME